jgi:putative transposase
LIIDAYPHRIVDFAVTVNLKAVHSRRALEMAIKQIVKRMRTHLIHHCDQGIKYCYNGYSKVVDAYYIRISVTENSDFLENSMAEWVNAIFKEEFLSHQPVR